MSYSANINISIGDFYIQVEAEYIIENDGIGPYEYWGAKCYDNGVDYPVIEKMTITDKNLSKRQMAILQHFIDKYLDYSEYESKIEMSNEPDYD